MKTLREYYTIGNLFKASKIGLVMVFIFVLLGVSNIFGLALMYVLVSLGGPAMMAHDDAINMEE